MPARAVESRRANSIVWSNQILITLLIILATACYANSLFNGFVYDDEQQILHNPYVKSWHYLPQIFGTTVWSFIGAAGTTNYYRPLMTFTYLVLWKLFGDIPFGFHLFNVALNAALAVLVFAAGRRLFNDHRIAFVAAVLFAVHPVHTEVVDWIAAVPELEATFFVLLTFWLFMGGPRKSLKLEVAMVATFALALLSKEPALMLAPLAIVYEHFVRRRSGVDSIDPAMGAGGSTAGSPDDNPDAAFRASSSESMRVKISRYVSLFVVALAYLVLRIALFGKLAPVLQHANITWPQAIYSAFALVAGYTKYLFWPTPLSAFHVFHPSESITEWRVLLGMAIVAGTMMLIVYFYKVSPAAAFCALWIGITLAPILNARWMAANVFAERYLYLPSVGFCWLVAWIAVRCWDRLPQHAVISRRLLIAAAAMLALTAAISIVRRNAVWIDDMTLYTRTLESNPDAAVIRSNFGALFFDQGKLERAGEEWETALAQKPDNVVTMNDLGILYTQQERYAEAKAMFQRVMTAKPAWGDGHYSYARLLQKTGDMSGALREFKTAVTLSPLSAPAHRWYGEALLASVEPDLAVMELQRAVELDGSPDAMHDLIGIYLRQARPNLAEPLLRRIVTKFPYDSGAHFSLGKILEDAGKTTEARSEYEAGLASDPSNIEAQAAIRRLSKN